MGQMMRGCAGVLHESFHVSCCRCRDFYTSQAQQISQKTGLMIVKLVSILLVILFSYAHLFGGPCAYFST